MKSELTSRERVRMCLEHKETDRVPIDLCSKGGGLNNGAYQKLKAYLKIDREVEAYRPGQASAFYDEAILEKLGIDFRHVFLGQAKELPIRKTEEGDFINEWGVTIRKENDTSCPINPPLATATLSDLDNHNWPIADLAGRIDGLKERIEHLYHNTTYALAYRPVSPIDFGLFETAWTLRGMENLFSDMLDNKKFVHKLLKKILEVQIEFFNLGLSIVGPYVQVVQMGDDYGSQNGPMFSPKMFREFLKPYNTELISSIKKKAPNAKIYLHSCGSVRAYLEDFIDMGVDILNPVQPNTFGMESAALKKDFGDRLTFQGAIDVQGMLQGARSLVEEEVVRRIDDLAPGGGYIVAPANNITSDIPPENIVHLYEFAKSYSSNKV